MKKGRLIGFAGKARSGKTTAAISVNVPNGRKVLSFAAPIKEMTMILVEQFHGLLKARDYCLDKEGIIPGIEQTPRKLFQTLGTEWGRKMIKDDLWVRAAEAKAQSYLDQGIDVAFDDVRFQNEVDMILENGGEVYYIDRPGLFSLDSHESENQELQGITSVITNDLSLELYKKKIANLFKRYA